MLTATRQPRTTAAPAQDVPVLPSQQSAPIQESLPAVRAFHRDDAADDEAHIVRSVN